MRQIRLALVLAVGAAVACQAFSPALAQERYPTRTVRIIVSVPAASFVAALTDAIRTAMAKPETRAPRADRQPVRSAVRR